MGLFDIFRSKPKQCSSCKMSSPGLHVIYSGLSSGNEIGRICTNCLISSLRKEITEKKILFIEPITGDGYCYSPIGDITNQGITLERVQLSLAALRPMCVSCSKPANHLWMPLKELDDHLMEKRKAGEYYPIPSEPHKWNATIHFCDDHIIEAFREYISQKKYYFLTFRFPMGGDSGYYS